MRDFVTKRSEFSPSVRWWVHFVLFLGVCTAAVAGINEWTYLGLAPEEISVVAVHPTNPDIIYAGATDVGWDPEREGGLFKSTDRGVTWDTLGFRNFFIGNIEISRSSPETIWIAAGYRGAWRSTDGGESWEERSNGIFLSPLDNIGPRSLAICPQDPSRLVVASGSDQGWGGAYYSNDEGESWNEIDSIIDLTSFVEFDVGIPGMVWLGADYFEGIWQSVDTGRTFTRVDPFTYHGGISDLKNPLPGVLWYSAGRHIKVTVDSGQSWEEVPPMDSLSRIRDLAPIGSGDTLAVDTDQSPFITFDRGVHWQDLGNDDLARVTQSIWHMSDDTLLFWSRRSDEGLWAITVVDTATAATGPERGHTRNHNSINIIPNPASARAWVLVPNGSQIHELSLYNMLGQVVVNYAIQSQRVNTFTIDLPTFISGGTYFLKVKYSGRTRIAEQVLPITILR